MGPLYTTTLHVGIAPPNCTQFVTNYLGLIIPILAHPYTWWHIGWGGQQPTRSTLPTEITNTTPTYIHKRCLPTITPNLGLKTSKWEMDDTTRSDGSHTIQTSWIPSHMNLLPIRNYVEHPYSGDVPPDRTIPTSGGRGSYNSLHILLQYPPPPLLSTQKISTSPPLHLSTILCISPSSLYKYIWVQ